MTEQCVSVCSLNEQSAFAAPGVKLNPKSENLSNQTNIDVLILLSKAHVQVSF